MFTLLGFLFSHLNLFSFIPLYVLAIFALLLYAAEYWAFLFKLKVARLDVLNRLSHGNPALRVGMGTEPGCMLFYAFLMRFVFRIVLGMLAVIGFSGRELNEDLNTFQIILMVIIVLFEVFNMMYSLFETHIFKLSGEDVETAKELETYWENEKKWRTKNFPLLKLPETRKKEWISSLVLVAMAFAMTHLIWDGFNDEFREYIIRTENSGESVTFAVIFTPLACFLLCLFFLMPIRLAFWIVEKMNADEKPEIRKYRWSLIFAGVSICLPTLIQLFVSFVF